MLQRSWISHIELDADHAGAALCDLIEQSLPTSAYDDAVAAVVQKLRESAANAAGASRDEDRISGDLHGCHLAFVATRAECL